MGCELKQPPRRSLRQRSHHPGPGIAAIDAHILPNMQIDNLIGSVSLLFSILFGT
jgi:hypothetical protein